MVRREITYKTENTNTIIYVLLHNNNCNILNLGHITSGLTLQVKTVSYNLKIVLSFHNFFELVPKLSEGLLLCFFYKQPPYKQLAPEASKS